MIQAAGTYDCRVKRLVALGTVVLCAGVGVIIWVLTRSNGPAEYASPARAVTAACYVERARTVPRRLPDSWDESNPRQKVVDWIGPATPRGRYWIAITRQSHSGRWHVFQCKAGGHTWTPGVERLYPRLMAYLRLSS